MKKYIALLIFILLITGCSDDDYPKRSNLEGKKYAHLFFETREECQLSWELYFMNCAQTLEILDESRVEIIITDIIYITDYYIENNKLVVQSSPDTFEFSQDLIFHILDDGNLKLGEQTWFYFEEDIYDLYNVNNPVFEDSL